MQPAPRAAQPAGVRARMSARMVPLQSWGSDLHALPPFHLAPRSAAETFQAEEWHDEI